MAFETAKIGVYRTDIRTRFRIGLQIAEIAHEFLFLFYTHSYKLKLHVSYFCKIKNRKMCVYQIAILAGLASFSMHLLPSDGS